MDIQIFIEYTVKFIFYIYILIENANRYKSNSKSSNDSIIDNCTDCTDEPQEITD